MEFSPYLSILLATIKEIQASRASDEVDVAQLGTILRKDSKEWTAHGFERLSAALAQLKEAGQIEVFRNDKAVLKVRSPRPSPQTSQLSTDATSSELRQRFVPLRSSVWFAFASGARGHQRMLNRKDGKIWFGEGQPPTDPDWVPIDAIQADAQKEWAKEFIERSCAGALKVAALESLSQSDWFQSLPAALAKEDPLLPRSWNHIRSRQIIEHVKVWAREHKVPEDVLFVQFKNTESPGQSLPPEQRPPHDLRQALLSAVSKMPTEDLLDLQIPSRLLIQVIRPDLLR